MNDSLRTDVFVRFNPETIACACIYLAARTLQIPLPNRPHWFLLFGATEEDIKDVCLQILRLYTRKKADLTLLESKVENRKLILEEAKAKAKGLLPDGTPRIDNAPEFSPSLKNDSPKEGKSSKLSPVSTHTLKNAKRKIDTKKPTSSSPVNGVVKIRDRSGSGSRDQSYSRSHSRSNSPKRRKSESYSSSSGSKSRSRSRSRSDSPPRKANHGSYKSSKAHIYSKSDEHKYSGHKRRRSRSRSSSPAHSHSRESPHSRKYRKKSQYYREQRRERSRSYERVSHRSYERDYSSHSHNRR
ncbi:cyclin-L2-like [Pelobates fuscus]|uniref:cyclin-L2-like n=1 Tax=Pelobates fuscus TaxID=191477 RepID=UPI002FE49159